MAARDDGDGTSLCKAKVDFDAPLPDRHALNLHGELGAMRRSTNFQKGN